MHGKYVLSLSFLLLNHQHYVFMRFQQGHKKNLQKAKVSEASNQARYCASQQITWQVPAIWTHQIEIIIITLLNHNWTMSDANVKDHTRLWGARARQSLEGYLLVGSWLSGNWTYTHSKKNKKKQTFEYSTELAEQIDETGLVKY